MINLPLDKKEVIITSEKGGTEKVSVLDKRFMTDINFIQYNAFPIHEKSDSPIQKEWYQETKILCYDLEILLTLPHEKFWVQLIHDATIHSMLSTYLQKAPRSWDIWSIPEQYLQSHSKLSRLVFLTLLRMSTDKESKECFLSKEAFGFTLYENYMFDIPKIIDLCSLYGHPHGGNGVLVNKMLTNIFTKQIGYIDDLKTVAQQLTSGIMDNITSKYEHALTTIGLYDLLCYYYDTCMSLICLFSTYPPTLNYFNSSEIILSFATLYSHLFHDIKTKLKRLSTPSQDLQSIKSIINRGQVSTVRLIHCIIWNSCLMDQLLDNALSIDDHTRCAEQFIAMLSSFLGDVQLMTKYYHECNLAKTFTIIQNSKAEIGQDHFSYILNAIDIEKSPEKDMIDLDRVHYNGSNINTDLKNCQDTRGIQDNVSPNDKKVDPHPEIEFLIKNVKDIFPQFSDFFLKHCLAAYNHSSENVIAALLENNLPPHLEKLKSEITDEPLGSSSISISCSPKQTNGLENQFKALPESVKDNAEGTIESSILASRQNIFDNDEFDVFNNPHDLNFDRIHIGKKLKKNEPQPDSTKSFLQNNPKFNFEYDEYEDEYDDTYDGLIAASDSSIIEPSEFVIKPLNAHFVDEDEGNVTGDQPEKPFNNYPTNHASSSNQSVNHINNDRGRGRKQHIPKPRAEDKVGQKAGDKVLHQRKRDNENKAARGNHNRKRGADKKRMGGMLHM